MQQQANKESPEASSFHFNPEGHRYSLGDRALPSVTRILSSLGLTRYEGPWYDERVRVLGEVLHRCCALIDEGDLCWESVDPQVLDGVKAYAEWKTAAGFTPRLVEKPLHSRLYGFAGTLDAFGGFAANNGKGVLIDRKRGIAVKGTKYQTAAYSVLVGEHLGIAPQLIRRFAIEKLATGRARMVEHKNPMDIKIFLSAAAVFNDAAREGIFTIHGEKEHGNGAG